MATRQDLPAPASDEPEYEIDSFELLWEQHKSKIIAGAIAVLVIVFAVLGWFWYSASRNAAAEAAFAGAKSPADYRAVIEKYGSLPEAGNASLLLAESLRDEKKLDEANAVLADFGKRQPDHAMAPLARIAEAENFALMGKTDDAVRRLEEVARGDAKSFAAPYALLIAAELQSAAGNREAALRTYRELQASHPQSVAAQSAAQTIEALSSLVEEPQPEASAGPTASPAAAAPAQAAPPADAGAAPTASPAQ